MNTTSASSQWPNTRVYCAYSLVVNSKPTAQKNALAIALSNLSVQLRNRETLALEHEVRVHAQQRSRQ